jgi:hypothetical protein
MAGRVAILSLEREPDDRVTPRLPHLEAPGLHHALIWYQVDLLPGSWTAVPQTRRCTGRVAEGHPPVGRRLARS